MVKVQDTYNPVTGEYVKRISDWVELDGSLDWTQDQSASKYKRFQVFGLLPNMGVIGENNWYANAKSFKYDSVEISSYENYAGTDCFGYKIPGWTNGSIYVRALNSETGFGDNIFQTNNEVKAYFHGWKMCNSDGTSPYYKSEVPYSPETWAEWLKSSTASVVNNSLTLTGNGGDWGVCVISGALKKASTKYGFLYNVESTTLNYYFLTGSDFNYGVLPKNIGNNKVVLTSNSSITGNHSVQFGSDAETGAISVKNFRIFELPEGSQIEEDFTNLSADELSAKYTFNGLCVKHWKKVTDGTGLTSTLPTASYEGYTPYKMIYQLANPEISYLTPKATIPLYDTNTIMETDTPSDCKADVTVGYKLKDGATAVAGDITAPTPDYMSAVNSVSEDGLGKGIVRSPNIVTNGNFANGTTGWSTPNMTFVSASNGIATFSQASGNGLIDQNINDTYSSGTKFYWKLMNGNSENLFYSTYEITEGGQQRTLQGAISSSALTSFSGVYTTVGSGTSITLRKYYFSDFNQTIQVGGMQLINLTKTFGAGNEPTKEQCDILFATWQDKASIQATLPTLRKIGTVSDTYNPETGVLVQRVGKKVLDGTENITAIDSNPDKTLINFVVGSLDNIKKLSSVFGTGFVKCSHLPEGNGYYGDRTVENISLYLDGTADLIGSIRESRLTGRTSSSIKTYMAQQYANGTPVTVYYQLAIPVVSTLATTDLHTYKPTTVIESDSNVKGNISADYKLKANATPVDGDFIASPEAVNNIKDLGNSIDVVSSVGRRNLFTLVDAEFTGGQSEYIGIDITDIAKANLGKKFNISFELKTKITGVISVYALGMYDISSSPVFSETEYTRFSSTRKFSYKDSLDPNGEQCQLSFYGNYGSGVIPSVKNIKIEISEDESMYTPAPENIPYNQITDGVYKTNILLSAPLRAVGDVKDRLFKDSDGKWKIERNIGEKIFDGTEDWILGSSIYQLNGFIQFYARLKPITASYTHNYWHSSHFPKVTTVWDKAESGTTIQEDVGNAYLVAWVKTHASIAQNTTELRAWLASENSKGTPVTIQYELSTPTYETLSLDLQTDLDNIPTFPEHNYVYTVANDNLQPTLHVDYKKLSWLKSRLLVNSLKIYSRNLTDDEMMQNYKVEKERFGM